MSDQIPDTYDLFKRDISYDIVPIVGDGWCLYRAYLTGKLGRDPTSDEILALATEIGNKLKVYLDAKGITDANYIRISPDAIINNLFDDTKKVEGLPYDQKGWATQVHAEVGAPDFIIETRDDGAGNDISHNMQYVTDVSNYVAALSTPRDGVFTNGPIIWPDVAIVGSFFTNPPIITYTDGGPRIGGEDTGKNIILLHDGKNHFDLIKIREPYPDWYHVPGSQLANDEDEEAGGAGAWPGASIPVTPIPSPPASPRPAPQPAPAISTGFTLATTNDPLTTEQIKGYLKDLSGNPDPRAKKLQVILASILLINAVRTRKLKRRALQAKPAEKKAAVGDVSGRVVPIKVSRGMIEGAFDALGRFGIKAFQAAKGLKRAPKPAVSIRTGVEALRRSPADIERDFSRAPAVVQRIARQPSGSYIQAGVGSTPAKKEVYVPVIPDLPEFKAGSIVSTYIKVGDRLLIHRRAKGIADEQTISTPSGWVDVSDGSYVAAAVREVKEESGLELQDDELMPLRVTQVDGKYMVAFYVERDALPDVPGPQPEFAKELDMKYDFAGISGQKAVDASGSASGHFLADIAELPKWLRTNKEFKNRMFYDNLVALMLKFPGKFTIPDDAANDVVYDINALDARLSWVPKRVFSSQDLKDTWLCQFEQTRVSPCEPWELRDALIAADKFKEHDRLGMHMASNPDIVEYRKMTNRIKELKDNTKPRNDDDAKELRTLEKEFNDKYLQMRKVRVVRSLKPGDDYSEKTFTIPNPVHALSYREDEGTNFANPSGTPSKYDPSGAMMSMNTDVLEAIAYPEMIADKHMAISILESLWYCAGDVSLSNEPRCFPARVLGQLREYEAARIQMDQQQRARDYMATRTAWPEIKRIIRAMKNALVGAQVVSFSKALEDKMVVAPAVSKPTSVLAASVVGAAEDTTPTPTPPPIQQSLVGARAGSISAASTAAGAGPSVLTGVSQPAKRPSAMGAMARGVAVVVPIPRGIGTPFGFEGLLPRPIGFVGASGR